MFKNIKILKYIWLLTVSLLTFSTSASDWQFDGFVSQGYFAVDDSAFIVGDDDDTWSINEAAVAASWKINEEFRLAGSLSYRYWGELAESRLSFDYAFLEYSRHFGTNKYGIRGGRFKNEFGFYSSTRDASFTRPSIMLPQSIYPDYFRDTQLHLDGLDLFGFHYLFNGALDWHLSAGDTLVTDDLMINVNGDTVFGDYDSESFYAFDMDYQSDQLRLGLSFYDGGVDFYRNPEYSVFTDGDIAIQTWLLSLQYRWSWFEVTAEHMWSTTKINEIYYPAQLGEVDFDSTGYYIDLRAYLPYSTELFIRYDQHIADVDDRNGTRLSMMSGIPSYYGYTYDWTVGGRWFISSNWMLAMEYHHLDGASWTTPLAIRNPLSQKQDWSMFALQLSYRF